MLDEFNKEHAGKVQIDATTLEWGVPFYTKVQTSTAIGQGPDIMTYHESRMPLGISTGVLSRAHARGARCRRHQGERLRPRQLEGGAGDDGKQYAVPFDIHSIILYYNKDMLKKAGLLGDDGKPKGLDGVGNWDAALDKLTANGVIGLSVPGRRRLRLAHLLHAAQPAGRRSSCKDGKFLDGDNLDKATTAIAEMQKWVKNGWTPANTEYPASIALFTSGKAAMHINGVWEVPTMVDLAKKGQAVRLGRDPDSGASTPTRRPGRTSHSFAIPDRKGNPVDARRSASSCSTTIHWFDAHSLEWASGGHIPAYLPVQDSAEFKALQAELRLCRRCAKTAVFDPRVEARRRRLAVSTTRPATTSCRR